MTHKYEPKISSDRKHIVEQIQDTCLGIGRNKNMRHIPRELTLFAMMQMNEKIITRLKGRKIDGTGLYYEMSIKYNFIDYILPDDPEAGDRENSLKTTLPDINGLTILGKNLAYYKKKTIDTIMWQSFEEMVYDAYGLLNTDEHADARKSASWSPLLDKYFVDEDTDGAIFLLDPEKDDNEDTKTNSDAKENAAEITEKAEQNDSQRKSSSEFRNSVFGAGEKKPKP